MPKLCAFQRGALASLWALLWVSLLTHWAEAAESPAADARRWLLTGRYQEAAQGYQELARQEPVAGALGWARCQIAQGQTVEAEKTLREALSKQPQSAELHAELAELLFQQGRYQPAAELVRKALELDGRQHRARWVAAELHRVAGRVPEAEQAYAWLVDDYNAHQDFTAEQQHYIGRGAAQYARWKRHSDQFQLLINKVYPGALKREANYWPAHLEAALLFLEKYNAAEAKAELDAALAINPNAAEALVARATLALQDFDLPAAKAAVDRALEINPRLVSALQCRADCLLADLRPAAAIRVLEEARQANPVDEETLGRLAAAYGAADGLKNPKPDARLSRLIAEVTQRNPHCGDFFMALASGLELMRRFPAAAEYYGEAERRLPQLLYARGQLGLLYMRLGREAEAAKLLEQSFAWDPFNIRVKNMLEVLDVLQEYTTLETEHFIIKYDRQRDELLARYAARYLEDEVYPQLVSQFGFRPPQKSLLEIFSRARNSSGHAWFSARMVGLPFVGTVAACAGQMVAIVSPSELPQKFNWAQVLRHEFVHVLTLQQTDFSIPHWYTEALAVLAENHPRPAAWTEILVRRRRADSLLNLDTLNLGFIRPKSHSDWTLAYCQAQLYAEFMQHRYGAEALAKLLAAYADNLPTEAALKRCFGVEVPEFEAAYRVYLDKLLAEWHWPDVAAAPGLAELQRTAEQEPRNTLVLAQVADAYLQRKSPAEARKYAQAALDLEPRQPLAAYVMARVYLTIGDRAQATRILESTLDEQAVQANHLALLASLRFEAGALPEAERLYRLGLEKCPPAEKWLKFLTRIYLKSGEQLKLTDSLRRLAEAEGDNLLVRKKLVELALAAPDYDAAVRWATTALQIDVRDAETHAQLGAALAGQKKYRAAVEELTTALQLEPDRAEWQATLAEIQKQLEQK